MVLAAAAWLFLDRPGAVGTAAPGTGALSTGRDDRELALPRVTLPADDAPHHNYMEWWYYNAHLRAADGREFSFHYVFFLIDSVISYTVSHISLTDHQTGKHYTAQQESAGNPSAGSEGAFNFTLGDWQMSGSDGRDHLKASGTGFSFDLKLTNAGPVLYHGGIGLIGLGDAGSSYYYSRPRMNLAGRLTIAGKTLPVSGQAWFDHQWGDFRTGELGWDWFALQLDDGADIMLYRLRDRRNRPVLSMGTYSRSGGADVLKESDFQAEPSTTWRSNKTGITYPVVWRVRIPSRHVDVRIKPIAQDSEIDARTTTYNTYWEGAVTIEGSHRGRGFLEVSPGGPHHSENGR